MAITQNFNIDPYYDDFSDTKGYHRILFRPGYAVQARELTQLQTILQSQIEKFGKHVFKQGSMVLGGQTTYENENVFYVKINDVDGNGNSVDVTNFVGKFIKKTGATNIRAFVVAAATSTTTDSKTLIVKYYSSAKFTTAENIEDEAGEYFATSTSTSATGSSSIVSIDDGVFFIDGFFVKVNRQTLILEKYSASPSYRVGLEITDSIVSETGDTSLLDPAQDASNYQAPGASRYKIELTLAKRTLSSIDDSKFVNLMRINVGTIEQRIIYPDYSVLEDTLARRTYDESGNYTVRPFTINLRDDLVANNASDYNIVLGPGKAYVRGYEFETISPTILTSPRARDFNSRTNYTVPINYQNHVDVTNIKGTIDLNGYTTLNVHSVPLASINLASATTVNSTKIGTIRIRALDYQYGANTTSIANSVWRAYVFDSDIGTKTANATGGTANTIILDTDASSLNDAYKGVKLRITTHNGVAQTQTRIITSYNGSTRTATTGSDWQFFTPNTNTQFSLDYEFKDAESFEHSNNTIGVNISGDSKYSILTDDYQGSFISEPNYNSLLLPFPNFAIKDGSIANAEYFGRKVYSGTPFSAAGVLQFSTGAGYTSAVTGSISTTDAIDNFYVVLNSAGTVYANNTILNLLSSGNSIGVVVGTNTSTVTITSPGANNATATVYMKVKLPYPETLSLAGVRKVKTKRTANTLFVSTTGADAIATGISLFNNEVDQPGLQLNINKANIANLTTASSTQSLYVADVISLRGVYDFGANTITYANLASATDITSNYNLIDGQNDNAYEHSSIQLKSGKTGPKGNVVIFADYYDHTGTGYITVDSYIGGGTDYKDIPTYTSPNSGDVYFLRDLVDFRLHRKNGSAGLTGGYDEIVLGTSGTSLELDYSYYLPRIDKVVVTKNRKFEIVQGVSSLTPVPPKDRDDAMTIYMLVIPPYVSDVSSVKARFTENRRYTMRDIGEIEQRVQNLEYYSTLNFLEKTAADETFLDDSTGLPRVKTGIVVDPFNGHKVADVTSEDYSAAIDILTGEVRPGFYTRQFRFELSNTSSNYIVNSHTVTPGYTETSFISQTVASNTVNINPFSVTNVQGFTEVHNVDPEQPATAVVPEVVDNEDGRNDCWKHDCEERDDDRRKTRLRDHITRVKESLKTKDDEDREVDDDICEGNRCYKREYNWWRTKTNRRKDSSTSLPVTINEKITGSTNATTTTYSQKSLDMNYGRMLPAIAYVNVVGTTNGVAGQVINKISNR
jgi:hypothetical protein